MEAIPAVVPEASTSAASTSASFRSTVLTEEKEEKKTRVVMATQQSAEQPSPLFKLQVRGLNIFYSSIKYTEKDGVRIETPGPCAFYMHYLSMKSYTSM